MAAVSAVSTLLSRMWGSVGKWKTHPAGKEVCTVSVAEMFKKAMKGVTIWHVAGIMLVGAAIYAILNPEGPAALERRIMMTFACWLFVAVAGDLACKRAGPRWASVTVRMLVGWAGAIVSVLLLWMVWQACGLYPAWKIMLLVVAVLSVVAAPAFVFVLKSDRMRLRLDAEQAGRGGAGSQDLPDAHHTPTSDGASEGGNGGGSGLPCRA